MSILNKTVSFFPSKNATSRGVDMNLLDIIQSDKHKAIIQTLRTSDAAAQKIIKEKLPCFTPSGRFSRRCAQGILQLSGLAAVDLDSAEDYDCTDLLKKLKKVPSIAYAGYSCRGTRLWAIVPFLHPDKYEKHYQRLIQSFAEMGLTIGDECHKQISQPRFVSWNEDSNQFFNHNAKLYDLLPPEKTFHRIVRKINSGAVLTNQENAFQWCNEQIKKSHVFQKKARHSYIVSLARYCNIKGVSEQDTLYGCLSYVQEDFTNVEIKKIVEHVYTKQSDSFNKIPYIERKKSAEIPSEIQKPEKDEKVKQIENSFVGKNGKFYIANPIQPNRYAVYNSPSAYNQRSHLPNYVGKNEAYKYFLKSINIDLETLLITSY